MNQNINLLYPRYVLMIPFSQLIDMKQNCWKDLFKTLTNYLTITN